MVRIENIRIYEDLEIDEILAIACKKNKLDKSKVKKVIIHKKSVDARKKDNVFYNYSIDIDYDGKVPKNLKIVPEEDFKLNINKNRKSNARPVIVGAGPAGLFCALLLAKNGYNPIVIERGKCVIDRKNDVDTFSKTGMINTSSNVQFGEGGAGTFSDGKLTTNIDDPLGRIVLHEFASHGAPEQIMYIAKPHIGTDNLIKVVYNIRNDIIEHGGTFYFETLVTDIEFDNNQLSSVIAINKDKEIIKIKTDTAVFAIGHSARDTFKMLHDKGLNMERKNFSVGVRIEHRQSMINEAQYGTKTKLKLPPAEYKLAYHEKDSIRSCYTFCMCPGGVVMASSSGEEEIVTNGMSTFSRDGENANSAVLVNVVPEDFPGDDVLAGVEFQRELEHKAFIAGGSNYNAPCQRLEDFYNNVKSEKIGYIVPSYKPGYTLSNLNDILPDYVCRVLKDGIKDFDRKIKGFADNDAILTGVETRSSSPVRILRNELLESKIEGLYPCGEGAGYAGGIMTAAMDGFKCAIKIIEKNN